MKVFSIFIFAWLRVHAFITFVWVSQSRNYWDVSISEKDLKLRISRLLKNKKSTEKKERIMLEKLTTTFCCRLAWWSLHRISWKKWQILQQKIPKLAEKKTRFFMKMTVSFATTAKNCSAKWSGWFSRPLDQKNRGTARLSIPHYSSHGSSVIHLWSQSKISVKQNSSRSPFKKIMDEKLLGSGPWQIITCPDCLQFWCPYIRVGTQSGEEIGRLGALSDSKDQPIASEYLKPLCRINSGTVIVAVYLRSLRIRATDEKNIPRPSRELMSCK